MYRIVACIVVAAGLTACAARSPNEGRPREDVVRVSAHDGRSVVVPLIHEDFVTGGVVKAPREQLWPLLPLVYEELGLPAPARDQSIWTVAVQNHTLTRRLGSERLSELINCGSGLTGANADTHRIRLSVRTWLEPAAEGTEVRTRVEAHASSVEGLANSFHCSSRGELEMRIAAALQVRSAGSTR